MATKETLISNFANGRLVTGPHFEELINSLKGVQAPVTSPSVSGSGTEFIDSISQDAEGRIRATKKRVNFSGYQTVAAMEVYQPKDMQKVGEVTAAAGRSQTINHRMSHFPTVRLIGSDGTEVKPSEYSVRHADGETLEITLASSLGDDRYAYILD